MNKKIQAELLQRCAEEQKLRMAWIDRPDDKEFAEQVFANDRQNTEWLRGLIEEHGWLGKSIVGKEGADATFLLVQHSPDLSFQQYCLTLLEAAVLVKEAKPENLAYLIDRVRIAEGKKQIYGTQGTHVDGVIVPSPIEDEANVDVRRKSVKLRLPLAKYFAMMNELYKTGPAK